MHDALASLPPRDASTISCSVAPTWARTAGRFTRTALLRAAPRADVSGRVELERVLEQGGALPPNPDALLPVARTLTYRTPPRPGESYHVAHGSAAERRS